MNSGIRAPRERTLDRLLDELIDFYHTQKGKRTYLGVSKTMSLLLQQIDSLWQILANPTKPFILVSHQAEMNLNPRKDSKSTTQSFPPAKTIAYSSNYLLFSVCVTLVSKYSIKFTLVALCLLCFNENN